MRVRTSEKMRASHTRQFDIVDEQAAPASGQRRPLAGAVSLRFQEGTYRLYLGPDFLGRPYAQYPRHLQSLVIVDFLDASVRVRTSEKMRASHTRQFDIVDEQAAPAQVPLVVESSDAGADMTLRHGILRPGGFDETPAVVLARVGSFDLQSTLERPPNEVEPGRELFASSAGDVQGALVSRWQDTSKVPAK